ncbi:hypothetical protein UZ36_02550 [Candidatus Nitromaritima sp. SCGC AAA799-C22]|nr:hypothetical protein UZ36_02550 [Candidatus Nitromaritima sp. SCGC AAA799-C22]
MIKSFRCRETEKIFNREYSGKFPNDIQRVAFRKLRMLNQASSLSDLRVPPANKLEALKGDRKGQYSIRINIRWRVCFKWKGKEAHAVAIVDYH